VRVIDLALKDLLQIVRDWKTALFMVVMPIVFTLFFGFVFGSTGEEDDPRLPVGFVDHDQGGTLSSNLESLLEASGAIRPVVLEGEEIEQAGEMVRDETLAAVVIVPAGFGERALSGSEVAAGEGSELTVIADQTSRASHMAGNGVQAAVMRLMGATQIAQISVRTFEETSQGSGGFESEAARQAYLDETLVLASEAWRHPPLAILVEGTGGTAAEGEEQESASPFAQSSPGMIVMFVVLGLMT
jgi:ABC-type Na+ efflux pump permease subunit